MKVITNSLESGDWIIVKDIADQTIWSGHSLRAVDLADILNTMNMGAELVEVDDEQIQEM